LKTADEPELVMLLACPVKFNGHEVHENVPELVSAVLFADKLKVDNDAETVAPDKLVIPLNCELILKVHEVAVIVFALVSILLFPAKFIVAEVALMVPLLANVDWNPKVNELLVKVTVPLLVIVFRLFPAMLRDDPAGKVMPLLVPIINAVLKVKLEAPPIDAEPVPANVNVLVLFTVNPPDTVSAADKVIVVEPLIVNVAHADATLTVGIVAVVDIVATSPATGNPVDGNQLLLLFQLAFDEPVQLYVLPAQAFSDTNVTIKTIKKNSKNLDMVLKFINRVQILNAAI
jgi:hypothetical protein